MVSHEVSKLAKNVQKSVQRKQLLQEKREALMKLVNYQYKVKTDVLTDDIKEEIEARLALMNDENELGNLLDLLIMGPTLDKFMDYLPEIL